MTLGIRKTAVLVLLSVTAFLSVCLIESLAGLIVGLLLIVSVFILQYFWWKQQHRRLQAGPGVDEQ